MTESRILDVAPDSEALTDEAIDALAALLLSAACDEETDRVRHSPHNRRRPAALRKKLLADGKGDEYVYGKYYQKSAGRSRARRR